MTGFDSARLKLDRAEEHIVDLDGIVASLPDSYVSSIKVYPQRGAHSIEYELPNSIHIIQRIALITGDAVHNIKTALDHAWIAITGAVANRNAKFPVRGSAAELESTLRGAKIHVSQPLLFQYMITTVKPYAGGDWYIPILHELDIIDKHRLILPIVNSASIIGIVVEDENGVPIRGDSYTITAKSGTFHIDFPINIKIKDNGHPSVAVCFDDGPPGDGLEIIPLLKELHGLTVGLVKEFERIA